MSETVAPQNDISAIDALKNKATLRDVETPFEIQELFFSRTDDRGVIKAGNDVFQRVSGLEWEQLLGAPHRIIRHPDMPKGVFYHMWAKLKEGFTFGGYIKNRSVDGSYYWVFAVVTPMDGGYLSARIKPKSAHLPKVVALYAEILKAEQEQGLSPEDSFALMERKLQEMGYDNYLHFSIEGGATELSTRRELLSREEERKRGTLAQLTQHIKDIEETSANVFETCEIVRTLPTNLQIRSSRLGSSAAPIGIIASDCSERTEALMGQMREISDATTKALHSVRLAMLNASVVEIQSEMLEVFSMQESESSGFDFDRERSKLQSVLESNSDAMRARLHDVSKQIHQFDATARSIKQAIVGMNVTRIMSSIESNILGDADGGIRDIIANLDMFQQKIPSELLSIEKSISSMRICVASLVGSRIQNAA